MEPPDSSYQHKAKPTSPKAILSQDLIIFYDNYIRICNFEIIMRLRRLNLSDTFMTCMPWVTGLTYMACLAWLLLPTLALATMTKGPNLSVTQSTPAKVKPEDGPESDLLVKRRRYAANLLIPIPVDFLGGMLLGKGDFFKEQRIESGEDATEDPANDLKNPNVAGLGVIYLPHAKEGLPRFFMVAARYGKMSLQNTVRPMGEYIIGTDINDEDSPVNLRIHATDEANVRALVRLRQFPGRNKWLLLIGYNNKMQSGLSLELYIPSHLQIGFETKDTRWKYYTEIRAASREYPVDYGFVNGWMDGYTTTMAIGVRRHLVNVLYLTLEAGVQKENMEFYDENGDELYVTESDFAPWGKFALETWIKNP